MQHFKSQTKKNPCEDETVTIEYLYNTEIFSTNFLTITKTKTCENNDNQSDLAGPSTTEKTTKDVVSKPIHCCCCDTNDSQETT